MFVLLVGCRTQPLEPRDAPVAPPAHPSSPPDFAIAFDFARPTDLAPPIDLAQPPACALHTRREVILSSIALLDPMVRIGQVVRLALDLPLRDCDRLADVQSTVQSGNA